MSLPLLEYSILHTFENNSLALPKEPFHFNGNSYVGLRTTAWESDELAWGSGDPYPGETATPPRRAMGAWHGPRPLRIYAGLGIEGATYERLGHDDLARLAAGARRIAWTVLFPGDDAGSDSTPKNTGTPTWRILVQNASGAVVANASTQNLFFDTAFADGSYIVWARSEIAQPEWKLPPDYNSVRGFTSVPQKFRYVETVGEVETEYVWDWEADVGRRPASSAQLALDGSDMYAEYQKLFLSGGLQTRGAWTQYIVSAGPQGSEWSALRVQVGGGTWAMNAGTVPAPGAALARIAGVSTRVPVGFDPLARMISCSDVVNGECYLSGTIATRRGPELALWQFHTDETATLLGTNGDVTGNICESALNPEASDTILTQGGKRLVLTFANLHQYQPLRDDGTPETDVAKRLPGTPVATMGHPGGRCLRELDGLYRFLTERFDQNENLGTDQASFYNRLQEETRGGARRAGPGTVFHGHNCAETVWNGYYGIRQNRAFSSDGQTTDPDTRQYLAKLESGQWRDVGMDAFPANLYRWQRVRALVTEKGWRLLVSGKAAPGPLATPLTPADVADGIEYSPSESQSAEAAI